MDAAALKSLLWLLIWGVPFPDAGAAAKGPGVRHDAGGAERGRSGGPSWQHLLLLLASCREKFEQDPAKYVSGGVQPGTQHGGHHG